MSIINSIKRVVKPETAAAAQNFGDKALDTVGSGLKRLMPKGGLHHPDSAITKGPNRSLFISPGKKISVLPGVHPNGMNKEILTGVPSKMTNYKLKRHRLF